MGRLARASGYGVAGYTLLTYLAALAAVSAFSLAAGVDPLHPPPHSVPYLVLLGLVPMILGHTMLNYALRFYSATLVTSLTLLEPFGAAILAAIVLGEAPDPLTPPAMAVTVAGAAMVVASEGRGSGVHGKR